MATSRTLLLAIVQNRLLGVFRSFLLRAFRRAPGLRRGWHLDAVLALVESQKDGAARNGGDCR